jgi:hypothetical protein
MTHPVTVKVLLYFTKHIIRRMDEAAELGLLDGYLLFNQWLNIGGVLCLVSSAGYQWN